jgi:hypothetical protein
LTLFITSSYEEPLITIWPLLHQIVTMKVLQLLMFPITVPVTVTLHVPGGGCGKVCGVGVADGAGAFVATGVGAGVGVTTGGLGWGCDLIGASQTQMHALPLPALLQVACARNVTHATSFFVQPFFGVSE